MKLTIEYDKDHGRVFPDGRAEEWVDASVKLFLKKKKNWVIKVSSALLVDFFRLRLAQGVISTEQIEFVFNGQTLNHNKYGRIEYWPKGYCDIPIEPMEKLLTIQADVCKKRAKKRKEMMSVDNELTGIQDISKRN